MKVAVCLTPPPSRSTNWNGSACCSVRSWLEKETLIVTYTLPGSGCSNRPGCASNLRSPTLTIQPYETLAQGCGEHAPPLPAEGAPPAPADCWPAVARCRLPALDTATVQMPSSRTSPTAPKSHHTLLRRRLTGGGVLRIGPWLAVGGGPVGGPGCWAGA